MNRHNQLDSLCRTLSSNGLRVQCDVSMTEHTTWKIGGPADCFVQPETFSQLTCAIREASSANLPCIVIGRGSNLLFADEGFRGLVLKIGASLSRIEVNGNCIIAEAGALACRVAQTAYRHSLTGLEHIAGIPGTIGGMIAMNAGSARQCIGDATTWVEGCDRKGQSFRLAQNACQFSYRNSLFIQNPGLTVFRCSFSLQQGTTADSRRVMLSQLKDRRRKLPRKLPNCGSVFKSTAELFAIAGPPGRIIELCGLKGRRVGDAEVNSLHANFITNVGHARAVDALALIGQIRNAVHARFGIWMEAEVRYVHPNGDIVPAHEATIPTDESASS